MKRMISLLLCVVLCLASTPIGVSAAGISAGNAPSIPQTGDVWDGTMVQPTRKVSKDGVTYTVISTCEELAYLRENLVSAGNYLLANNLILNDVIIRWDENGNCLNSEQLNEWIPIELYDVRSFTGTFDGQGYTISGLYIDDDSNASCGLFGSSGSYCNGTIKNVNVVNSLVKSSGTTNYVGGIVARCEAVINCKFSGAVVSNKGSVGGVAAYVEMASSCENYGTVIVNSGTYVGGVIASGYAKECINYGTVISNSTKTKVGGIVGQIDMSVTPEVWGCINYGAVSGNGITGGISGEGSPNNCANYGKITGNEYVGGISGKPYTYGDSNDTILNCLNCGVVSGNNKVGGIVGEIIDRNIKACYNIGNVTAQEEYVGAIAGYCDYFAGYNYVTSCYYGKDAATNNELYAFGNHAQGGVASDGLGTAEAKPFAEMQLQSTFEGWDFETDWTISPDINGGYPYLQWQENSLSNIPVTAVQINEASISLAEGDYAYLNATVSPINASNQAITWSSSDSTVATVTAAGKVTAAAAGTATITAKSEDGGHTATCTVTVTERKTDEYKINGITIRDNEGKALSSVPKGEFLASVSITNLASNGDTLVFLSSYTADGRYKGLMWVSVRDLPVGATIEVTLPVDNKDGTIAQLKAFPVASFSDLVPLGSATSFPAQ